MSANVTVQKASDTVGVMHVSSATTSEPSRATEAVRLTSAPRVMIPRKVHTPAPRAAQVVRDPPTMRETFTHLANPTKVRPPSPEASESEYGSEFDDGSQGTGSGRSGSGSEGSQGDGSEGTDLGEDDNEPFENELRPREGFKTLDEEKTHLVMRLERQRNKNKNIPMRKFSVHSDIRDLRAEYKRFTDERDLESSLAFQRKMLMGLVRGIEFVNGKYSPFDVKLEGWADTVFADLDSYEGVFEDLFWKYKEKVSAPPEIRLLLTLGGSAMMFHYSKSLVAQMPKFTPEQMAGMQAMAEQYARQQQQQQQGVPPAHDPNQRPGQAPPDGSRPPMRGPGMDMGMLLGSLPANPFGMGPPPPIASRPPPQAQQQPPTIREIPAPPPPGSPRLSDVVSDLSSVPDDLQSMASSASSGFSGKKRTRSNVKRVTFAADKKPSAKKVKNVVVI